MEPTLPSPAQRQHQLQRQQRELDAFRPIEALATLRDHWQPEDAPVEAAKQLADNWHAITVKTEDIDVLREWPHLPMTLPAMLDNPNQQIEQARSWHLEA